MAVAHKLTVTEFLTFCELPENADRRFELIYGTPVEIIPSSIKNSILAARLTGLLATYTGINALGFITGPDGGYELGPQDTRIPDVGFITKARAGTLIGVTFPVAPDLAVEVVSPSETASIVRNKVKAYLDAGTQLVWTVYPDGESVDVHYRDEHGQHAQTYTFTDILEGGTVLPGFQLKVADIFAGVE